MSDFLFELGTEELPSGAVKPLADALAQGLSESLTKAQISFQNLKAYSTPRRLALSIEQLAESQPNQSQIKRGPAVNTAFNDKGEPTPALLGFAKSCSVEVSELKRMAGDKGEWFAYEVKTEGQKTKALLPNMLADVIAKLPIAKPMRWGEGLHEFARPVHWVVMLFKDEIINCEILGVKASNQSYGHRFHHPKAIEITKAKDYESLLEEAFVVADFAKRKAQIIEQIETLAQTKNAKAVMPESLVDEVTSIVEWPEALIANFEKEFLDVPAEALIASMQAHQKCFALKDNQNALLAHFITISNIKSTNPSQVIAGNEKVMRARLSDAAFFFKQDKKEKLSTHVAKTDKVIFQQQLGSLKEKAGRVETLMVDLSLSLNLDKEKALRAALLSKCDLMTGMVGEFPELQGLMGYYYALHDGEDREIAIALNEQYMPRFAADELPASKLGLALSLADRLDTLVGIFAIGQKPSGVKDPFKLRRHALAVVRLLLKAETNLSLDELIEASVKNYEGKLKDLNLASLKAELKTFIFERLQSYYQSLHFNLDLIQAVRAKQEDDIYDFDKRIHALVEFIKLKEAESLASASKRVNNILSKTNATNLPQFNEVLVQEGAEKALMNHIKSIENAIEPLYQQENYASILNLLASLREPVDAFFESVMVMVEDEALKLNRLTLLKRLDLLLQGVADISLLQLS